MLVKKYKILNSSERISVRLVEKASPVTASGSKRTGLKTLILKTYKVGSHFVCAEKNENI